MRQNLSKFLLLAPEGCLRAFKKSGVWWSRNKPTKARALRVSVVTDWVRRRGKGELLMVEYHKSSPALAPPAQGSGTAPTEKYPYPVALSIRRTCMHALRSQWVAREGA